MIGFSEKKKWCFIQRVHNNGEETDKSDWEFTCDNLQPKSSGRNLCVLSIKSFFIQKLLPNGLLGSQTDSGSFEEEYDVMTTGKINGLPHVIGHLKNNNTIYCRQLCAG